MIRTLKLAVVAGMLVMSAPSYAAYTVDQLTDITKLAIQSFRTKEPTHAKHANGFKSWISGEDAKVKIYVNHDGATMEFNYLCHDHDAKTECHDLN